MEKETLIQCVPIEMMDRLKKLLDRLWADNNPAGVHLGAIMDEFDADIKSLTGVVKEYESDFAGRLKFVEDEYREKIRILEADLEDCKARMSGLDKTRQESSKKAVEFTEALKRKEEEVAAFKLNFAENEAQLNSKYVAKMQELYDKVSRKELEMFSHWEEKNKALEIRCDALESEYAGKARQAQLREKELEDGINFRKEELIKAFDKVRLELENREREMAAREASFSALEKKRPTVTEDL
jgi:cysteinyl-tRNA synthetase